MQQTAHCKQKLNGGLGGGIVGGKNNYTKKRNNEEGGVGGSAGCAVGVWAQASKWCMSWIVNLSKEFRMALVPKILR